MSTRRQTMRHYFGALLKRRVMTVTACAAVLLFAVLPAAPVLAAGTTTDVLVFGGIAWQITSLSSTKTCGPLGGPPCLFKETVTLPVSISGLLLQAFKAGTVSDAYIWTSRDGQGQVAFLSPAIVSEYKVFIPNPSTPAFAQVTVATQILKTVCDGPNDSCVPPVGIPTMQLASSANPATAADTVTYTAREPTLLGAATPSGTVTFSADNAALPGCTNIALTGGQASCATSSLSVADHVITAQYSGDDQYIASTATLTQTINPMTSGSTPPTLSLPPDQTVEATGPAGAIVTYTASATDAQDGTLTPTCSTASGSQFPLGVTPVNCSATDSLGLTTAGSFIVTVVDTTPPSLNLPSDITAEATGPGGAAVSYTATATDLVDGSDAVMCTPDSGSTFPLDQATTVSCSATDASGNTATGSFTVTVVDTTPPSLNLPSDITAEATGAAGAAVSYTATATDLVDGSDPVTCAPDSGSTFRLDETTSVNCSATDAHGNTATGSFTVTVIDTTPPALNLPSDITAQATASSGAAVSYTATATDLVDGSVPVNCTPPSGSTFSVGTTTVSCSATDAHGNTATGSFTVTVSYAWTGFLQPVDNPPIVNIVKAGSAIPVVFSLTGDQGLNIFQTAYPASAAYTCNSTAPTDAIDQTVTAGNSSLSYDPTIDQYTYVWKTDKAWAGTCRALVVKLADGTTHTADFQFK